MTKPIIYGTIASPPVRCVLMTAKAIGLEIEYREVSFSTQDNLTESYLKMNPQHTVPTMDDCGKIVWDSHAIAGYLIDKYAKDDSLYPKDLYLRARVNQRLHFDSGILFPPVRDIIIRLVYLNIKEIDDRQKEKIREGYNFLEKFLKDDAYLVGNSMTLADLSCLATVTTTKAFLPIDPVKYPKLTQWMERLSKRPFYDTNQAGLDLFSVMLQFLSQQ